MGVFEKFWFEIGYVWHSGLELGMLLYETNFSPLEWGELEAFLLFINTLYATLCDLTS